MALRTTRLGCWPPPSDFFTGESPCPRPGIARYPSLGAASCLLPFPARHAAFGLEESCDYVLA